MTTPDVSIPKVARGAQHTRPATAFASARDAFGAFLDAADIPAGETVLLPAFVGWSANEGSGVFDPVRRLGVGYRFYPMTDALRIDIERLAEILAEGRTRVLVVIHFFGYVDPAFAAVVALARSHGVLVLEDEAHAMLTDLVGGASGRQGDAAVFSLHKLLPVPDGGMLVFNDAGHPLRARVRPGDARDVQLWDYDLQRIAAQRIDNARVAADAVEALGDLRGELTPLWDGLPAGVVPQTYPVVVEHVSRDALYFAMNEAGFGVVSLYHTMVAEIDADAFPAAHRLARRILNLPVHQDADADRIRQMVVELGRQTRRLRDAR